jgi:hypothetical protein
MQRWEPDFSGGVDEPDVPLPDSPEGRRILRRGGWIDSAS